MGKAYWSPRSKYGARKTVLNGIKFDSEKECRRWCELQMLEKAGEVTGLERQVPYELIPSQWEGEGKHRRCIERAISYKADFVYKDKDGKKVYTTDIVAENVEFCESKGTSANNDAQAPSQNGDFMSIPDGMEEELPFN